MTSDDIDAFLGALSLAQLEYVYRETVRLVREREQTAHAASIGDIMRSGEAPPPLALLPEAVDDLSDVPEEFR